jgi:hypothetical protein
VRLRLGRQPAHAASQAPRARRQRIASHAASLATPRRTCACATTPSPLLRACATPPLAHVRVAPAHHTRACVGCPRALCQRKAGSVVSRRSVARAVSCGLRARVGRTYLPPTRFVCCLIMRDETANELCALLPHPPAARGPAATPRRCGELRTMRAPPRTRPLKRSPRLSAGCVPQAAHGRDAPCPPFADDANSTCRVCSGVAPVYAAVASMSSRSAADKGQMRGTAAVFE